MTATPPSTTPSSTFKIVTINDDEDVQVDESYTFDFYLSDPDVVNESVFKCAGCKMLTVHEGYQFIISSVVKSTESTAKRVYLCTNCGKFGSK